MVSALRFDFYYQGQPLDVSACEGHGEVRPTEALMNEARTVAAEKQAEADAAAEAAVQALAEDGEEEEPLEKPETRQGRRVCGAAKRQRHGRTAGRRVHRGRHAGTPGADRRPDRRQPGHDAGGAGDTEPAFHSVSIMRMFRQRSERMTAI